MEKLLYGIIGFALLLAAQALVFGDAGSRPRQDAAAAIKVGGSDAGATASTVGEVDARPAVEAGWSFGGSSRGASPEMQPPRTSQIGGWDSVPEYAPEDAPENAFQNTGAQ